MEHFVLASPEHHNHQHIPNDFSPLSRTSAYWGLSPQLSTRQFRSHSMYTTDTLQHTRAQSLYGGRAGTRVGSSVSGSTPTRRRRLPAIPPATPPHNQKATIDLSPSMEQGEDWGRARPVQAEAFSTAAHLSASNSSQMHRKVYEIRSAESNSIIGGIGLESLEMTPPLRSTQSFRHRARTSQVTDLKNFALDEVNQERRRSTPTVSRRCSLQKAKIETPRTDVWPEPKQMSEIEERFLKLPDSQDYTRVRQFKIDSKGAVVSRGDSFRRKRQAQNSGTPKGDCSNTSPFPVIHSDAFFPPRPSGGDSRSGSVSSSEGSVTNAGELCRRMSKSTSSQHHKYSTPTDTSSMAEVDIGGAGAQPSTSHPSYKIYVLGQTGSGKSSLVSQFITSEYRNAFADDIEENTSSTTVSINIGGHECDLTFFETDPQTEYTWKEEKVQAYLLLYSIDRKSSFRTVVSALEEIREQDKSVPIILAGNKIDLERRRAVSNHEVKCVALTYDIAHFEISVALNHDVDDLLVGIVAEIKESFAPGSDPSMENVSAQAQPEADLADDFRAAIRRFSQRKKRQMGSTVIGGLELETGKCTNLNPAGLFEKFRQWRRGMSKC